MSDLDGKTIKRYQIVNELGRGGMAVVYQAVDTLLGRKVAIKLIQSENRSREKTERLLRRFSREAKALASLSHPNIVKVLDYGDFEGAPYLVMEFIARGSLRARMNTPIPFAEAAAALVPICRALQHAHDRKIIHRDIKPENILLNDSDQLLLSDFGVLKFLDVEESQGLTGTGKIVGTYAYMSPEQIRGVEIDGRADIYSLGIVYFEMITGRKPYSAGTPIQLSVQHLYDPIPKAKQFVRDLPAPVEKVIASALAKQPEARYPNMSAFAEALEGLGQLTSSSRRGAQYAMKPTKRATWFSTPGKKKLAFWTPAVVVLLATLIGLGYLYQMRQNVPRATPSLAISTQRITNPTLPPSPTQTRRTPTRTPIPTPTSTNPLPSHANAIGLRNAKDVSSRTFLTRLSIRDMDWIDPGNWLINSGSQKVSFISGETLEVDKEKVINLSEIPLSMAAVSSTNTLYLLFNSEILAYDLTTREMVHQFTPIAGGARSIAVSPDGKLLALGISDFNTQLMSATDGTIIEDLRSNYGGWAVAFSPDSKFVASGTSQGALAWSTETHLWFHIKGGQDQLMKTLAFSHDGQWLAGGGEGVIFIWSMKDGNIFQQIERNVGSVNGLDFSPDDAVLVSATDDGIVRIWDPKTGSVLKELSGHKGSVDVVCFSPDGSEIASGAEADATIHIWGLP